MACFDKDAHVLVCDLTAQTRTPSLRRDAQFVFFSAEVNAHFVLHNAWGIRAVHYFSE